MGIAAQDLPLIFKRFTQLDSSLAKKHQGTGLGLTISIQLAELMDGALTATSDLGCGTTFRLTLPLPAYVASATVLRSVRGPDQPAASPGPGVPVRRRRILLAEDHPVNQKIGVLMFEKLGCSVDIAANGREAAEMADRCSYDIIFMDCGMPEMDGYAATRRIRERQKRWRANPHRGANRPRDRGGPRTMSGGRHGRLHRQAHIPGNDRANACEVESLRSRRAVLREWGACFSLPFTPRPSAPGRARPT